MENGTCAAVRIGLTNVSPVPMRAERSEEALIGKPMWIGDQVNEEILATAGKYASEDCEPSSDLRGSEEYKRAMVDVLIRRMLTKCLLALKNN